VALAHRVKEAVGAPAFEDADAEDAAEDGESQGSGAGARREDASGGTGLAARLWREEDAKLQVVADRSIYIEQSVNEVGATAAIGGLLAVLVLFMFLRQFKATFIIALAIPISIMVAFAPLKMLGVSLNIMSLGGIALGIGMLVDSSIVVLESIARCREEGDPVVRAAFRGVHEVRSAVMASTLTTIAVFLPMVFVEGIAGQAFGDLGFAVTISLIVSTFVALFFVPMLASRQGIDWQSQGERARALTRFASIDGLRAFLGGHHGRLFRLALLPLALLRFAFHLAVELVGKVALVAFMAVVGVVYYVVRLLGLVAGVIAWLPVRATDVVMRGLSGVYPVVLRGALGAPLLVLLLVGLCLWGSWRVATTLDSELLPEVHQGEFTVEASLPVGTPLEQTDAMLTPVEEEILEGTEDMAGLLVTLGYDSRTAESSEEGEHTARFKVLLKRARDVAAQEDRVVEQIRQRLAGRPDVSARVVRPGLFSTKTPLEVEVHGDDLRLLREYAERTRAAMAVLPQLADVETTLQPGAPELQILYNRDLLSRYGLNIQQVAQLVRSKVQGREATRFNMKDRRIPIVVRLLEEDRQSVEQVRDLIVNPGGERPIPLSAVAEVILGEGPSEIRRVDGNRVALVRASMAGGSLSSAAGAIRSALDEGIAWPVGMSYLLAGQNEEWDRSRASLWLALGLSVFLVYVIMASQFESLVHPLVIMLTIPLAFVGTLITIKVLQIPLSVVVILGTIMLAGIVVNNAIVLVDYINRLRRRGLPRDEAIVTAGAVRLRPILMTALTTILGLLPLALALGEGAEIRAPMAVAVISGLVSSTVLTLLVIPSMYKLFDGLAERLLGRAEARASIPAEAPDAAAGPVAP
jgi:HAE1 family hydrophobic/amphiphilic exporter-1